MDETKYGEYITREPMIEGRFAPSLSFIGAEEAGLKLTVHYITEPYVMIKEAHKHDDVQFLCFYGGNPANIKDFKAEVEIYLGEEGEKHIINTSAVVYIPKGLIHCPLNFKRVDKPITMLGIYLSSKYART